MQKMFTLKSLVYRFVIRQIINRLNSDFIFLWKLDIIELLSVNLNKTNAIFLNKVISKYSDIYLRKYLAYKFSLKIFPEFCETQYFNNIIS